MVILWCYQASLELQNFRRNELLRRYSGHGNSGRVDHKIEGMCTTIRRTVGSSDKQLKTCPHPDKQPIHSTPNSRLAFSFVSLQIMLGVQCEQKESLHPGSGFLQQETALYMTRAGNYMIKNDSNAGQYAHRNHEGTQKHVAYLQPPTKLTNYSQRILVLWQLNCTGPHRI